MSTSDDKTRVVRTTTPWWLTSRPTAPQRPPAQVTATGHPWLTAHDLARDHTMLRPSFGPCNDNAPPGAAPRR